MLYVEIPPYRDPNIYHPAKVNFYVVNGKSKHSQPQHFTYMPLPGNCFSLLPSVLKTQHGAHNSKKVIWFG